jgi:hypothetical protein
MTVHSKQLGAATGIGTANVTLYTCPANFRTIVKSIYLLNLGAAQYTAQVNVFNGSAQIAGFEVECGARHTATASALLALWLVLNAGDSLRVNFNNALANAQAIASGAELHT